jgi:COP9 signalosome complex subunit 4
LQVDQDDEKEGRPVATRYLLCFARIQDYRRKFVDAAKRYFDLTLSGVMGREDVERTLQNAVTCCILGQAGPSRSRVLGLLHGDERTHNLANFPMLQAMYKDQLVRPEDSKAFQRLLAEHQNVTISGGITVLQQSVIQHNLVAVSRVYKNISFEELGRILGISADKSEEIGAGMINAGVLEGATIDQVDGFLEFSASSSSSAGSEGGSASNPQLKQWDEAIGSICAEIQSSFSALVEARQAAQ